MSRPAIVVVFLGFSLCAGQVYSENCTGRPAMPIYQSNNVSLEMRSWNSHRLLAQIARIVLEEAMGFQHVELVPDGTTPTLCDRMAAPPGTSKKVDMNLEMWSSPAQSPMVRNAIDNGARHFC